MEFEWTPDLKEAQLTLMELEGYVRNTAAPMFAAQLIAIDDMQEHFYAEEDPEGDNWPYWADSYAMTAQQENVGILRKSEDLFYAATEPDRFVVTPAGLFYEPPMEIPYWAVHQFGELSKPRTDNPMSWRSAYWSGEPGGIPQRAYIGLSAEAQAKIDGVFVMWLQDGGEVFQRRGKRVQAHVFRAPTGQFISAL